MKKDNTKEMIFEKAIQIFLAHDFNKVTMRELAKECNLSLGAFYYHFKSKEEIISHFYKNSFEGHSKRFEKYLSTKAPKNLIKVMTWICEDRFNEFQNYKSLLAPCSLNLNRNSPVSPWAEEHKEIRTKSIELFSKLSIHCLGISDSSLQIFFGKILWLHHLLIVAYWMHNYSPENDGRAVLNESIKLWKWLIRFSKIPGSSIVFQKINKSLLNVNLWRDMSKI